MDLLQRKLLVAYGGLALAGALLLLLTEIGPGGHFLDVYGPNFVSELAGILVTVFLVDRLLRWEHERRLQPFREVAVKRVRRPIASVLSLYERMHAQAAGTGRQASGTWAELLSGSVDDPELNFSRVDLDSRAPTAKLQSWGDYAASVTAEFEQEFLADVDRYAEVLSIRLIRAGHHLLDALVFTYLKRYPELRALSDETGQGIPSALPPVVTWSVPEFVERASELVAAYDESAPPDERLAGAQPD